MKHPISNESHPLHHYRTSPLRLLVRLGVVIRLGNPLSNTDDLVHCQYNPSPDGMTLGVHRTCSSAVVSSAPDVIPSLVNTPCVSAGRMSSYVLTSEPTGYRGAVDSQAPGRPDSPGGEEDQAEGSGI